MSGWRPSALAPVELVAIVAVMQTARSLAEAEVFLDLEPCECGEIDTDWEVTGFADLDDGRRGVSYSGLCRRCGLARTAGVTVLDRPNHPPPDHFSLPDDGPSSLLDAAVWWAIGMQYHEAAPRRLAETESLGDPAPAWRDHAAWSELRGLLTRSAAAADEVLKFLPDDAISMPMEAFWSPPSRGLREREAASFTRAQLTTDQAERWRVLGAFLAEHPEPQERADQAYQEISGPDDDLARLPVARSNDEAQLYLRLHPCTCGETEFVRNVDFGEEREGVWVLRYSGSCVACGQHREFAFRQRQDVSVPSGFAWAAGTEPGELLDAGEWMWVADALLESYPIDNDDLSGGQREDLKRDLAMSAAAVDEVLKFLPPGADSVPSSAFWTNRGRLMREAEPASFDRDLLQARRKAYLANLAGLDDQQSPKERGSLT